MKSKKLLLSTCLFFGAIVAFISLNSSSSGISSVSSSGCGGTGCHISTSVGLTSATLNGLPLTGFVPGNTYTLTLLVTNSTKVAAGFDLGVSDGAFSAAPANTTIVSATEIRHSAPKLMTSGTTSWTFNWTAPIGAPVVFFNIAANAVDNTGTEANDSWTLANAVCQVGITTSLNSIDEKKPFTIYPNPSRDYLLFKSSNDFATLKFEAYSIQGIKSDLQFQKISTDQYQINTNSLANGIYMLNIQADGKHYSQTINKQ